MRSGLGLRLSLDFANSSNAPTELDCDSCLSCVAIVLLENPCLPRAKPRARRHFSRILDRGSTPGRLKTSAQATGNPARITAQRYPPPFPRLAAATHPLSDFPRPLRSRGKRLLPPSCRLTSFHPS